MKKLLISILGLLCMASCNDNAEVVEESYPDFEFETHASSSNLDYIQQRIGMEHPQTRAGETVSIEPYVYEGDTVMYIVNYEDGWELYSNDTSLPMILGKSDTGSLDLNSNSIPENLKGYFENTAALIHARFSTGLSNSQSVGEWGIYVPDSIAFGDTLLYNGDQKYDGEPHEEMIQWTLIEQQVISVDSICIPHIMYNKWHQYRPWNVFVPYYNSNPRNEHYAVGCGAVAVAQYLHHMATAHNYIIPIPQNTQYDIQKNSYIFYGDSTVTIWNNMALDGNSQTIYTDSAALALGYIGQKIGMTYGSTSTSYMSDAVDYLNSIGFRCYLSSLDFDYIFNCINLGYPVICRANARSGSVGHRFVIDGVKKITKLVKCTYEKVRDTGSSGSLQASRTLTIFRNITLDDVQINWGWGGSIYDDNWYAVVPVEDWEAANAYYYSPSIIKIQYE